ncbi:MAG: hypothetical protein ACUVQ1_09300 [Candidatus Kapaibacteriales bacterium]
MRLISLSSLLVIFLIFSNSFGQESKFKVPYENFGAGAQLEFGLLSSDIFGGTLTYAVNPDMHLGLNLGFLFDSGDKNLESSTYLTFGPFLKYFITNLKIKSFYPFIKGQFLVANQSVSYKDVFNQTQRRSETHTKILAAFGSEWFPISSLGIYASIRVLEFQLDPTRFFIGTGPVSLGIEWFF